MKTNRLTPADLISIQQETAAQKELGRGGPFGRITVHMGTCGLASGAAPVLEAAKKAVLEHAGCDIAVTTSGCIGLCSQEPLVTVERANEPAVIYKQVTAKGMERIFLQHALEGKVQEDLALAFGTAADQQ